MSDPAASGTAGRPERHPLPPRPGLSAAVWRDPAEEGNARHWVTAMARVGAGAVAFPIAVLVHELGHYLVYLSFGLPGVVLRYASVSWSGRAEFWALVEAGDLAAAGAFAPPWQVAFGVAAGPTMTYLTIIACVLFVRRYGPHALALGIGFVAPLRWLPAGPILIQRALGRDFGSGTDEARFALLTGFPDEILLVLGLVCLVGGWWLLLRTLDRGSRADRLAPILLGIPLGGIVWALWLGPLVLP